MPNKCHTCGASFAVKGGVYDAYLETDEWLCPECYFGLYPDERKRQEVGQRGYSWGT